MGHTFKGTGVALITPFLADNSIDFDGLSTLVENQIENGTDYLVVLGTTAETATLSQEEKQAVINAVVATNQGRLPVIVGVGGNNTESVITDLKKLNLHGANAILSVVPYYNKPTQEGIYQHYKAIAENSPVPVMLYNVPSRTGASMTPETTIRLAREIKNLVGIKDASGDLAAVGKILRDRPNGFHVISGDDSLIVPILSLGGDGVISVAANAIPKAISSMTKAALEGNFTQARTLHLKMLNFIEKLFVEGNPGGVKAALFIMGKIRNQLRLPLVPVSDETIEAVRNELEQM